MKHESPERATVEPFFYTWSAQEQAKGIEIVGGQGAFFDTAEGERYLDFGSLTYHANLGHGSQRMVEAIKAQADRLILTMPKAVYPEKRALARRLLDLAGEGFERGKVLFTLGGSEAVENALKIIRLSQGRYKFLSRHRSYHGATMGALSVTGDYRRAPLEPLLPGALKAEDCYCERCPFGKEVDSCEIECATHIETILRREGEVGGVFMEPIVGANGVLIPPDAYWPKVRAACDAHGALLIADEVLTGFGRTGRWFGFQHYGVVPDLITLSKGLTGGYGVLGAVLVHERVAKHFERNELLAGLTQYAHPLGVAAALEALAIYEEDDLINKSAERGAELEILLRKLKKSSPRVEFVRNIGLLAAIEVDLGESEWPRLAAAFKKRFLHIYLRAHQGTLVLAPPLCIKAEELADGIARIESALAELG